MFLPQAWQTVVHTLLLVDVHCLHFMMSLPEYCWVLEGLVATLPSC